MMDPREPLKTNVGLPPNGGNGVDHRSNLPRHTFPAELQGKTIQCGTLADAIVIRFAEHALTSSGESPYDERTLRKIAELVERYGETEAAERLKRIDS